MNSGENKTNGMEDEPPVVRLFGIDIHNITLSEALDQIKVFLRGNGKHFIVTPNVDHIVQLHNDSDFYAIYKKASLVVADGTPVIWASNLLGKPLKERVAGSDLLLPICELSAEMKAGVFLMGGMPGVPETAAENIKKKYPNINISGCYSPPFGFEKDEAENNKIVKMVNESAADILFVALGAPKQEKWISKHIDQLNIKVAACVGAGVDFVAGSAKRAPKWTHKIGLEWLWRLLSDPKRLWKRYLIQDTAFIVIFLKEFFSKGKKAT